jgi:starch phosphorylase
MKATRRTETAREMFPGYRIRAVTNGVQVPTWAHPTFVRLFQTLAADSGHDPEQLATADGLSGDDVWAAHTIAKAELIAGARRRTDVELRPDLPLIAFARQTTSYKRPDLIFADLDRLRAIYH